jgi:hypothetical protein
VSQLTVNHRPTALVLALIATSCFAQSARDYYNELYAAGGLDQITSYRVCFNDEPELRTFFVFVESKVIREVMMADGSFSKADRAFQAELKKRFVLMRGYDKGVPLPVEEYRSDNGSWVTEQFMLDKATPARIRFEITPETLRYKRSVEILRQDGSLRSVVAAYGRCEAVSPEVRQHGK